MWHFGQSRIKSHGIATTIMLYRLKLDCNFLKIDYKWWDGMIRDIDINKMVITWFTTAIHHKVIMEINKNADKE